MFNSALRVPQLDKLQHGMLRDAVGDAELRSLLSQLPAEIRMLEMKIRSSVASDDVEQAKRTCRVLMNAANDLGAARLVVACNTMLRHLTSRSLQPVHTAELFVAIDRTIVALDLEVGDALQNSEFELHYQPWVDLNMRRIAGCEALMRWRHPKRGLLGAAQFVPMAEESGLIAELSAWVFQQACRDAAAWPDGIKVSINLSLEQYASDYLRPAILAALTDTGLEASRLELEIIAPASAGHVEKLQRNLQELRRDGVGITLDRFGGYQSSLDDIRKFDCTRIKIDRSLVASLMMDSRETMIVSSLVSLAKSMGIAVTAEGIEFPEQVERLREAGCIEMQGFLFYRPQSATEVVVELSKLAVA